MKNEYFLKNSEEMADNDVGGNITPPKNKKEKI